MKDTLKSSREIDTMFRTADRVSGMAILVLARRTPEERGPMGRVAFVAGKKLGNAVARNRAKRVLRAAARECGSPWPGWDVVLVARRPAVGGSPDSLADELEGILRRAGVSQ